MWATTKYVSDVAMSTGITARKMPERPPITNVARKPQANSMGVVRWITPRHIVASHENILIPVGTAIAMVVNIIGMRSHGAMPETNMWCAHTVKPSTPIATVEIAISLYPKIGLREWIAITSEMI